MDELAKRMDDTEDKFLRLKSRATVEIAAEVLRRGEKTSEEEAHDEARRMFDELYDKAVKAYFSTMTFDVKGWMTGQRRAQEARNVLEGIRAAFAESGYIGPVTAQRLAAVMPELEDNPFIEE